jgi:hypothetical protein
MATTSTTHFPPPVLVQIKKGEVVAVAPEDVKEAELEYPLKPWNRRGGGS